MAKYHRLFVVLLKLEEIQFSLPRYLFILAIQSERCEAAQQGDFLAAERLCAERRGRLQLNSKNFGDRPREYRIIRARIHQAYQQDSAMRPGDFHGNFRSMNHQQVTGMLIDEDP